ncbi:MAG: hypothetical protein IT210_04405 [Armatimonadetes bacterium]|nr:hypothetical protein [Armatimonadota bacterium]
MPELKLTTFALEVTPPVGHPLCGGWIKPVEEVTDPMYGLGVVLAGEGQPVALCALDWCEVRNLDHTLWRQSLAEAVGTTPERVAIQCVHPHNAPITDIVAQEISDEAGLPAHMDIPWFRQTLERAARAAKEAMSRLEPVSHITVGKAKVEQVASNRRILGLDGKIEATRWSSCTEEAIRAEPEGLIDPFLQTVGFWNGERKLASLHYYATHPMSYYGDGKATCDFAGLARDRRSAEEGVPHLYFTGCAGNITAGKYNDGSPAMRPVLSERIYRAMTDSESSARRIPAGSLEWCVLPVAFPLRPDLNGPDLGRALDDPAKSLWERKDTALAIAYLRRLGDPILLTALRLGDSVTILHLPGEPFIEYQLYAKNLNPNAFVAVSGYGDGGTGYIPLAVSYAEGGYEPTATYLAPESEAALKQAIEELVLM